MTRLDQQDKTNLSNFDWMNPNNPIIQQPRYIGIEGCIGAGKTTFAQQLADLLGYKLMLEPVETNPLLPKFYEDPKRYGFSMQARLLTIRLAMEISAQAQIRNGDIPGAVLDRTADGDTVFAKLNMLLGNIDPDDFDTYLRMFSIMKTTRMYLDLLIFLSVPVDILQNRIRARNRSCEKGLLEDRTYLTGLNKLYEDFVFIMSGFTHVVVLDWSEYKPVEQTWAYILEGYQYRKFGQFDKLLLRH